MQLVKPLPFAEAVEKLGRKTNIGSKLSSSEWRDVPVALRERAFFSSRVESARVLQRARDGINDFLKSSVETLPNGQVALATGSRADFVKQTQDFLRSEGIERKDGGLQDLAGERRLGLIFNTQTRQANDFGTWKQGQDPDLLNEFPAQRFIRVEDVEEPRNSHTEFEGQVYLKTDPIWATINDDFGVPWGPWGWGCGHDVEDVDRAEAEALGLIGPNDVVSPIERDFNEGLQASTRGLDPDLLAKLQADFGEKIVIEGDVMQWRTQARPQVQPAGGASVPASRPAPTADQLRPVLTQHETELATRSKTEKLVALDARGRVIAELTGTKNKVSIPADVAPRLKDAIVTHNHPEGSSFSPADLRAARNLDMKEIRAVGVAKPYNYSLQRPEGGWPKDLPDVHKKFSDEVMREFREAVKRSSAEGQKAMDNYSHEVMLRTAAKLNLKYERTERA